MKCIGIGKLWNDRFFPFYPHPHFMLHVYKNVIRILLQSVWSHSLEFYQSVKASTIYTSGEGRSRMNKKNNKKEVSPTQLLSWVLLGWKNEEDMTSRNILLRIVSLIFIVTNQYNQDRGNNVCQTFDSLGIKKGYGEKWHICTSSSSASLPSTHVLYIALSKKKCRNGLQIGRS